MRSEGFLFYLGALGVDLCSLDVAFVFAFATAGSTSAVGTLWGPYGRAYSDCCKSGHLWRFQTSCNVVSCGRCGTLWHPNMFHCVSKVVLCDRHNTFQKRTLLFRARHSTLETSMFILRGMRSTLDMSCCVFFCESHCQGCVKWWQRAYRSLILHGRRSIWWRSVVCGMSFWVAGAVFGTLFCLQLPLPALARLREVRCCLHLSCHFAWQTKYLVML